MSVMVLCYQHKPFLEQCLGSIANQEYRGDVRVIVADDASTDGSQDLLREWAANHEHIELILHRENLGPAKNFEFALNHCEQEILAFCEGDDYWTDPHKLEKQVALLIKYPDVSMCFSDYCRVGENGEKEAESSLGDLPERFGMKDLLYGQGPSVNATIIRRKTLEGGFAAEFYRVSNPDVFIFAKALLSGPAYYLPEVCSAYRIHAGGIWSKLAQEEKKLLRVDTRVRLLRSMSSEDRRSLAASGLDVKLETQKLKHSVRPLLESLALRSNPLFARYARLLTTGRKLLIGSKLLRQRWRKR